MPPICEFNKNARIQIEIEGSTVYKALYLGNARYELREYQPPWNSRVRWTWGGKYQNIASALTVTGCPIVLGTELGSTKKYLFATNSAGGYVSGQFLDQYGNYGYFPNYPKSQIVPAPELLGYVTPPPPKIYYLDLYADGGFIGTWQNSGSPPVLKADCSCDLRSQIQCGEMYLDPSEDTWCCIDCNAISSFYSSLKSQINSGIEALR